MAAVKPARKQAERREEAEAKILNAAIRLLVDRGYDRFTLADVGEAAGYSRALPAHYFGKKDDLLNEVVRFIIQHYRANLAEIDAVAPGLPYLVARIRTNAEAAGTRQGRALLLLQAEATVRRQLKRTIIDFNLRGEKNWEEAIRRGMDAGHIRPDVNARHEALVIFSFLRGQNGFAAIDPKFDVSGTTEYFIATLVSRIATAAGRRAHASTG
ncbi:helix-turn-helix domain-containing protein [Phenylobacterium sp.]|uniref:TetR/AcrR family transcriptional regulator n=1 Tax=Phenylobacterium sp. TaxID=1871053 RepID=UPI00301DB59B